jgi:transposase
MGKRLLDTYEKWEQQGTVKKKLDDIKHLVSENISQKKISEHLGITEKTLIKLKKKHKRLADAFIDGKDKQLAELIDLTMKLARGYTIGLKEKSLEDNKIKKNNNKNKVVIKEKHYPPNLHAIKFIMNIKHGINERREELDLMKERIESRKDEWPDATDN